MLDAIIIGAGPAGLTATLYAQLYGLQCVCVGDLIGGKLVLAPEIIDYPGIPSINGKVYVDGLSQQLTKANAKVETDKVNLIEKLDTFFKITTVTQKTYESKTIILATGNANKQRDKRTLELVNSLGIKTEKGLISVNERYETSHKNIYAAGDAIIYPYSLEQLVSSVSSGIKSTASVFESLRSTKPPILWGTAKIPRILSG